MDNIKFCIVGLGVIGNVHAKVLDDMVGKPCAVCDIDKEKLEKFSDVKGYTDYVAMLTEIKPDVVHICTPHYLHADMIIEALNRDINVLCEKPLCIKLEDIDRILEAERRSKAQLGVCHQNRYNKENAFLKEYLQDKKVVSGYGSVVWDRDKEYYAQAEWRGKWATEGGGVLINQALHTLDLMQWFAGMPENVTASTSNFTLKEAIEVEDTASIICSGGGNFSFFATNGSCTSFPVSIMVKTEDELIRVMPNKILTAKGVQDFKQDERAYGKCCYGSGHNGLIRDFYDCVKTGRKFEIDGQEGSKVIRIILGAYESNGRKINI